MSKQSCALCCSMLSAFGVIFLGLLGFLMQSQPQYIKSLGKDVTAGPVYNTAIVYAGVFAASIAVYFVEARKTDNGSSAYEHLQMSERVEGVTNEKTPLLSR
ncbi:hypothetical protein, variant [Saprolegnia diclina VS20]|uniref:Uncharacterized protein n=1 Tax=Saprolegnia diclina (strain VS20) TaxID=1156394 RepID=T0PZC6_SAPDV|nr:hypothetical protein, variant [Saprolegnia diclina VS20]EQC27601.1 hypothetical protein, variant [Saprolegnia diclina VS20]|eukprot:XP_008619021.1 hypothetical protein, variant [Saprolegnia diclina VS20]